MAASGLLRERDLRALTAVIEYGLRDGPGPAVPWAVLHRLHQLIPADAVLLEEADLRNRQPIAYQTVLDGEHQDAVIGLEPEIAPGGMGGVGGLPALHLRDAHRRRGRGSVVGLLQSDRVEEPTALRPRPAGQHHQIRDRRAVANTRGPDSTRRVLPHPPGLQRAGSARPATAAAPPPRGLPRRRTPPQRSAAPDPAGSWKFSNSYPRGTATSRSPERSSSQWRPYASTWRTSSTAPASALDALQPRWPYLRTAHSPNHHATSGDSSSTPPLPDWTRASSVPSKAGPSGV